MHRPPSISPPGGQGRRRGARRLLFGGSGRSSNGGSGGGLPQHDHTNGVGGAATARPPSRCATLAPRIALAIACSCLLFGVAALFQHPGVERALSASAAAAAGAAGRAAVAAAAAAGASLAASKNPLAAANPLLPVPPLLQLRQDAQGQQLRDDRRWREQQQQQQAAGGEQAGGAAAAAAAKPALPPSLPQPKQQQQQEQQHQQQQHQGPKPSGNKGAEEGREASARGGGADATAAAAAAAVPAAARHAPAPPSHHPLRHAIWWFGPIFSASGYGTEAIDFLLALARSPALLLPKRADAAAGSSKSRSSSDAGGGPLRASHHGDAARQHVVLALPPEDRADLSRLAEAPRLPSSRLRPALVVCHTFPTNVAGPSAEWARWRLQVRREAKSKGVAAPLPPGEPCPPDPRTHAYDYVILRTMYETHVPPPGTFVRKCNSANEVWVPSRWNVEAFARGGVERAKLRAVPEGVNTTFFDPMRGGKPVEAMDLGGGKLVFGRTRDERKGAASGGEASGGEGGDQQQRPFVFLSSFKWEPRKGWDVLLNAYLSEFAAQEDEEKHQQHDVELHILTRPYAGNGDFAGQMRAWADASLVQLVPGGGGGGGGGGGRGAGGGGDRHGPGGAGSGHLEQAEEEGEGEVGGGGEKAAGETKAGGGGGGGGGGGKGSDPATTTTTTTTTTKATKATTTAKPPRNTAATVPTPYRRFPAVYVHTTHLADLPALYAAADAFVLPSRGEGWGRPHVEAMAMALPLIATNWSGPTEFLDETVGYPIGIEGLEDAGGGLKWAKPSVPHLRRLMRRVVERREEASAKGAAARRRMVERYSPEVIARVLEAEFRRIEDAMP
jgi:glycosyltransferase involved in cell wall biosynthesis